MSGNPYTHFPGDYNLRKIEIITAAGKPLELRMGSIAELNIYEDIESNALTGSAVIIDSNNIISNLPFQGLERIAFKLSTPGAGSDMISSVDASQETGHPFHIYALTDRKIMTENVMSYTIHFGSRELMRNTRTKVSQAYTGELHLSALQILRDSNGLDSQKRFTYEPTRNQDKFVMPNVRPFDAINILSTKALSGNANGAGYYFYETTKGFHFRSYESMLSLQGRYARDEIVTLKYEPRQLPRSNGKRDFENQHNVESYEFLQHFDTLTQQAMGTYASRVITHNLYDKSYNIEDYSYHDRYFDFFHTDKIGSMRHKNYAVSDSPVDHDPKYGGNVPGRIGDKTVSDYPDSNVMLQGSTRFLHNENTGMFGTDPQSEGLTEAIRVSQENQVSNSSILKIVMPGHSYLQAGDVIYFELPSHERNKESRLGYGFDEFHSGRYLIKKLRHRVIRSGYQLVLECIKDSVRTPLDGIRNAPYPGSKPKLQRTIDLYTDDRGKIGMKSSPGHPANKP